MLGVDRLDMVKGIPQKVSVVPVRASVVDCAPLQRMSVARCITDWQMVGHIFS
jgi:hypothetical protein